jgi:hypothetical protein
MRARGLNLLPFCDYSQQIGTTDTVTVRQKLNSFQKAEFDSPPQGCSRNTQKARCFAHTHEQRANLCLGSLVQ